MKKITKKNLIILFVASLLVLPVISLAVAIPAEPGAKTIEQILNNVLGIIWKVAIALATVMVIAAGVMFIMAAGSPDKVLAARQTLIYAIVGIVIAVVAFSLGTILQGVF